MGISWLELAISPPERLARARAVVHPLTGLPRRCDGVTVAEGWLCGSGGNLVLFAGYPAATRFMRLLHFEQVHRGGRQIVAAGHAPPFQCFRLGGSALEICDACHTRTHDNGRPPSFRTCDDEDP